MMIRQNLLVIGLMLITVTGCATTMSQNCGGHCSAGKQCRHQHRCRAAGRCRCSHPGPLFPGDAYGQPMGTCSVANQWSMGSEFGGCCDSGMSGGCSTCGSDMSAMMMPPQSSSGCNCGGQHSGMPEMAPMMMSPQPQPQQFMKGEPAPAPPAVFEAPKADPAEQNLPPVPNDAAPMNGAPPAGPVVDPVSWETPVFFPMNNTPQPSSVSNRRSQPVQVR